MKLETFLMGLGIALIFLVGIVGPPAASLVQPDLVKMNCTFFGDDFQ